MLDLALIASPLIALLAVPVVLACGYLLLLTLLSGETQPPPASSRRLRFDVIVPAHDEAALIGRTVTGLQKLDWPPERFRILVVADNCNDDTAERAHDAGAEVLERHDPTLHGKGYALRHAFARSRDDGFADAVVVVDADTDALPNLLEACAARIEAGADAVQVHYGVRNPQDSWRTRLMTIAMAAIHALRSRARERLGLSCGIRGNGWCLTHALLRRVPYQAWSLAEDLEYGIELGMAGVRVAYADEAEVLGDMVSGERSAATQRQRWESGRFAQIRSKTMPLLRAALARRSAVCLDLGLDLLVLPLSYIALAAVGYTVVAMLAARWLATPALLAWIGVASLASIAVYVLRGWQLSGVGRRGLIDLARAPFFVIWKVLLILQRRGTREWLRTERETGRP
ncbi:MAG: glycosyl transferase [Hydrocarboniphaga sp.]|uniref:glycosyltransferase family 2 protein n=1 Tax=Hydrocarboniphaga sp. TaxID=2033016 RepID=UPI00261C8E32|nr:glycosyltransferase family 2 protein [Hydrocarboniphaga sp.]MDB5969093.1 glycosyl transferase [Hydrocarboniphaga sp.]